jgi:hypothetical protein
VHRECRQGSITSHSVAAFLCSQHSSVLMARLHLRRGVDLLMKNGGALNRPITVFRSANQIRKCSDELPTRLNTTFKL